MSDDNTQETTQSKAYVWDLPLRVFHWCLVIAVTVSLVTDELGEIDWHVISGHVVLALIAFRIVWGVVGGRHARFADFVRGPGAVLAYAKGFMNGTAREPAGHNPMGALSVIALLLVLSLQAGTGLFANDDIFTEGPFAKLVDKSTSDYLTYIHSLLSDVLYALIALHLAAITFYTVKGYGLIRAMFTGTKSGIEGDTSSTPAKGNIWIAVGLAVIAASAAYVIYNY